MVWNAGSPAKCKISALSRWMKLGFPAHGRPVPQLLRSARKQRERTTTTQWKVHKQLNPFMIHQHSRGTGFQSVYLQTKEGGTNPNPSSASPGLPLARWCGMQASWQSARSPHLAAGRTVRFTAHDRSVPQLLRSARKQRERTTTAQ